MNKPVVLGVIGVAVAGIIYYFWQNAQGNSSASNAGAVPVSAPSAPTTTTTQQGQSAAQAPTATTATQPTLQQLVQANNPGQTVTVPAGNGIPTIQTPVQQQVTVLQSPAVIQQTPQQAVSSGAGGSVVNRSGVPISDIIIGGEPSTNADGTNLTPINSSANIITAATGLNSIIIRFSNMLGSLPTATINSGGNSYIYNGSNSGGLVITIPAVNIQNGFSITVNSH